MKKLYLSTIVLVLSLFFGCNAPSANEAATINSTTEATTEAPTETTTEAPTETTTEVTTEAPTEAITEAPTETTTEAPTETTTEAPTETTTEAPTEATTEAVVLPEDFGASQGHREWYKELLREMGLSNLSEMSDWNTARAELENTITDELDETTYGWVFPVSAEYREDATGYRDEHYIGIKIYYIDYDAVKEVVDRCLEDYDESLGRMVIEYEECDHSMRQMLDVQEAIEAEMKKNKALRDEINALFIYKGYVNITIFEGGSDKEIMKFITRNHLDKDFVTVGALIHGGDA